MGIPSPRLCIIHLFLCLYLVPITFCQPNSGITYYLCSNTVGNYTNSSIYKTNLNTLLASISSEPLTDSGFYNISVGQAPNIVNGIALCRGDVTQQACHQCLNDTAIRLPLSCPAQKEATWWYETCMLRYSNDTLLGIRDYTFWYLANVDSVSNADAFNPVMVNLLSSLMYKAASGNSQLKFATGQDELDNNEKLYALAQCTPDLSYPDCFYCIGNLIDWLPTYCANKRGARVVGKSCNIRYEFYQFYNLSNMSSPPPLPILPAPIPAPPLLPNSTASGNGSGKSKIAILITVPTLALIFLTAGFYILCRRKKTQGKSGTTFSPHQDKNGETISIVSLQYEFNSIKMATNNFADSNKLGQGGFGTVYKGILPNGKEIAVKRLSMNSGQGDGEFKTEVLLVAKLQHRNLVRLLGFCLENKERLLIYEFVPNTSLDQFLFDISKRSNLDWEKRYKIIRGIARGLLYLHEESRLKIIHRDLKASNVLLDADMNPKIADFGTARLFGVDQSQGDTSRIVGTYGYMAPEYALHGLFSVKADVYSFGVLVLEIITGRKNTGSQNRECPEDLLSFVWRHWKEGTVLSVVDSTLSTGPKAQIMRLIHMGLLCVQENEQDRPTMSAAVLMLSSHSFTLPAPTRPAYVTISAKPCMELNPDHTKDRSEGHSSMNEDSITDLYPR